MGISAFLSPSDTLIDLRVRQDSIVAELSAAPPPPRLAAERIARRFKREELGSTGTGGGVAIPRAHSRAEPSFGILARLTRAIDFAAIDGRPVDLVFLLLLPANPLGEQLKALASVARKFRDPACLRNLRAARTSGSLYDAMAT
jgi:PTS system nitrogen regulatory IIA component